MLLEKCSRVSDDIGTESKVKFLLCTSLNTCCNHEDARDLENIWPGLCLCFAGPGGGKKGVRHWQPQDQNGSHLGLVFGSFIELR